MKLQSVKFALRILHRGEVATFGRSDGAKTLRQRRHFVAMAVPNVEVAAQSIEEFRTVLDVQRTGTVLASPGKHDLAAKVMRHQHQPVTNSQYGNAERENLWVYLRSSFVINTRWSARED